MGRYTSGGIGRDVVAGALAGAAAVWLIDKMDLSLSHAPGKGKTTGQAETVADKAADKLGASRDNPNSAVIGHTVHYGVGIGVGALYGLLRGMAPSVTTGRGTLYGLATFILADEVGSPALGLTKSPLEYPTGDHARGALAHTVFGIFTDLGTRLISPWRDEIVILRGPSLAERLETGRGAIEDGRDYLYEQGRHVLDRGRDYLEYGRDYAAQFADEARSRFPDEDDVADLADRGRKRARRAAESARSYLPDEDDVSDFAQRGRKQARSFIDRLRDRLPDADEVAELANEGRKRVRRFADDVRSRLPGQDDLEDVSKEGRKRARRLAKEARERLPDRDDVDDLTDRGRKSVRRLSEQARAQAEEYGGTPVSRALRWLFG